MILAHAVPPFTTRGFSGCTDEDRLVAKVGTSKKGSTISLLAVVHLGHMPQAQLKRRRKPSGDIAKTTLRRNPQGVRIQECHRKTWKKTVEEEASKGGKTWSKIKRLANSRKGWKCFTAALFCTAESDRN
jgi:hypothetical protein